MVRFKLNPLQGSFVRSALVVICAGAGLSACASIVPAPEGLASAARAPIQGYRTSASRHYAAQTPGQSGPRYKVGAPYQAGGIWYVPAEQPNYDEVGLASWYGDQFNGKPTADGELFDMNGISAAHATLPMPSIVEVTNLDNGRTLKVRLNDRGPFHPGRIIDLSRGAAKALGFFDKGTARVRVRFVSTAPIGNDANLTFASNRMQAVTPQPPIAPERYDGAPPESVPAPSLSSSFGSGFAVQAGAFLDRANAERVAARLASAGRATVLPFDKNGSRLYRVTVGAWSSANDAGAARDRVASLGFSEARVIGGL